MTAPASRRFLFLQGPLSPLYARLANALEQAGGQISRINLNIGDQMDWRRTGAVNYRGRRDAWGTFIDGHIERHAITDMVLHGDQRFYHRIAADKARARGVRVIATELGYLRPDWMTIERDATSIGSHFPDDPDHIRRIAARLPETDFTPIYANAFHKEAVPDVIYNLANSLLWFLYPHYRRHTIDWPIADYAGWLVRLATQRARERAAARHHATLKQSTPPFFVFTLQLEGDFQIRAHSQFTGMADALDHVLGSFAAHGPADGWLVAKNHPRDNGLRRWRRVFATLARKHGLEERAVFVDGGGLAPLLAGARGHVTVNSSAGLESLRAGCPTLTLSPTIYSVDGLTAPGPLDRFWRQPGAPDPGLFRDFERALAATVQVRGTIYSDEGLAAAVDNMARRILEEELNTPDAFVDPPPRLAKAKDLGVTPLDQAEPYTP